MNSDNVSAALASILILAILYKVWSTERENSKLKGAKRETDLEKIAEANRLRDTMSLVARANEYWRRRKK